MPTESPKFKSILSQRFSSTQIPVCLWFLAKNKNADAKRGFRDRHQQTLFTDARKLGTLIDRVHRELTDVDGMRRRFLSRENESTLTLAA